MKRSRVEAALAVLIAVAIAAAGGAAKGVGPLAMTVAEAFAACAASHCRS